MQRLVALVMIGLALASAAVIVVTSSGLPPMVATHFGRSGAPNGWMSRAAYTAMMASLAVGLPLLLYAGTAILPPRWPRLVNRSMREYWLAPERRDATLRSLGRFGLALAYVTVALTAGIHVLTLAAHRASPPHQSPAEVAWLLVPLGGAMATLLVAVAARFRAPRAGPG